MKKQDFKVNYILSKEKVQKDYLISDFFDSALNQIEWFRQKTLTRETPFAHDEAYIKANDYSKQELEYAKENAIIEDTSDGVMFSFPIRNSRKDFSQKNEEGRRMWLRQHLDDHFLHYALPAMSEKSFNWEKDEEQSVCERFKNHQDAITASLHGAYNIKTKTFWIDGE